MRTSRIENLDADDAVKAYLKRVSRESHNIFRQGHIRAAPAEKSQGNMAEPTAAAVFMPRLPSKKKRQRSDSDCDEPTSSGALATSSSNAPQEVVTSTVASEPPPRTNFMTKWLQLASTTSLTLSPAALPLPDFAEDTYTRFVHSRERLAQSRIGIELLLQATSVSAQKEILENHFGFPRSSRGEVQKFVERIRDVRRTAPQVASLQLWHEYLEGPNGPLAGTTPGPSLALVSHLDHAHASTLLHVVVTRLQRGAKFQRRPPEVTAERASDDDDSDDDSSDTNGLHADQEDVPRFFVNDDDDGDTLANDANYSEVVDINGVEQEFAVDVSDRMKEALRFLRHLMPISSGGRTTCGYGVWLYSALVSVDLLLDPETDRALHELFRSVCIHTKTIMEAVLPVSGGASPVHDVRGALLAALKSGTQHVMGKSYWSADEIDAHDIRALHTLLVILARSFNQNQNHLVAL